MKRLGLKISSRTRLDKLSIAQQQMVEIAKALSLNARIIIMDEPTSSLTLTVMHEGEIPACWSAPIAPRKTSCNLPSAKKLPRRRRHLQIKI